MTISIFVVNLVQFVALWIFVGEASNFYVNVLEKAFPFPVEECLDSFLFDYFSFVKVNINPYKITYLLAALLSTFFMQMLIIFCVVFRWFVNKIHRDENF